ncbi:unnamed protein product [Nezara viridula]|uniref:Uncharacterized protein n=1 Tax=Nezara viridula TaxID=85310 RepID=A0A9P0MVK6_NEZVI|nr:unnamed protein product [Nezara viridula]
MLLERKRRNNNSLIRKRGFTFMMRMNTSTYYSRTKAPVGKLPRFTVRRQLPESLHLCSGQHFRRIMQRAYIPGRSQMKVSGKFLYVTRDSMSHPRVSTTARFSWNEVVPYRNRLIGKIKA